MDAASFSSYQTWFATTPVREFAEQLRQLLTLSDPGLRLALVGTVLLAINSALLGSFLVVRRMAMTSDTLSHAVLPGIMLGYLWNMTKSPSALLIGAVISGVFGTWLLGWIKSTTKLGNDAAQGIVLSFFLGLGICLWERLKRLPLPPGAKESSAGLDQFLFGQMAGLKGQDVTMLGIGLLVTLATILIFHRGLLTLSFDPAYGRARGLRMGWMHGWLMLLTTVAIVLSMEAVGVVLISALMVIPAATAALWTKQLRKMFVYSASLGAFSAVLGISATWLIPTGKEAVVPAGPAVVLASAFCFGLAFLFSPRGGSFHKLRQKLHLGQRVAAEDALLAAFRWLEQHGHPLTHPFPESVLVGHDARRLRRSGWTQPGAPGFLVLTEVGQGRSKELVRAHRLWELYLTQRASFAQDHVHEDAEEMEHMLTPEVLDRIATILGNPTHDPHGREIPGAA